MVFLFTDVSKYILYIQGEKSLSIFLYICDSVEIKIIIYVTHCEG